MSSMTLKWKNGGSKDEGIQAARDRSEVAKGMGREKSF